MLLRTKLSLTTLLFFVLAAVGMAVAINRWVGLLQSEVGTNVAANQVSLWQKIIDGNAGAIRDDSPEIIANAALVKALGENDVNAVRDLGRKAFLALSDRRVADRVEIFGRSAALVYSSERAHFPTPILSEQEIERVAFGRVKTLQGLEIDIARNTRVVLAVPLGQGLPAAGVAALSLKADRVLAEFRRLTNAEVFLINRRGRLMAGTAAKLWRDLTAVQPFDPGQPVQSVTTGGRIYWITAGRAAGLSNPIGYVVAVKDVTESREKFRTLETTTYSFAAAFLLLAALALWAYMRRSLNPLTDAVRTLQALSQGTFPPRMRLRRANDEVSLIGYAIDKFRGEMMRLARMTRSRRNRSRRQSRIIRRELTNLADTLDPKSKQDILNDLREVEARVEAASDEDEDTRAGIELAAIALTLSRLRERIQRQHKELADTIDELEEALESKNAYVALQHELSIGTRVQLAMLPDDLPSTERLSITGYMEPAKEVGGDFYDFFYLDDDRLGVVVADVSGKGVPAALFMAISRSILRATAVTHDAPGACLAALNDALCDNNKEDLFVTVFYGILDLTDGTFVYANGGHNPPYHLAKKGGKLKALPLTNGVALGVMDGLPYAEDTIRLKVGDVLYLYTDGVTEAINETDEEYTESRLEAALAGIHAAAVDAILKTVVEDVHAFAGDTPQADDITCVALRLEGTGK